MNDWTKIMKLKKGSGTTWRQRICVLRCQARALHLGFALAIWKRSLRSCCAPNMTLCWRARCKDEHATVTVLKQLPGHTGRHTSWRRPEAGAVYLCSDLRSSGSELLLPDLQEVSLLSNMTNSVVGQPRSKATKNIWRWNIWFQN